MSETNDSFSLRPMTEEDLGEVSALGIRSKASWGYSDEAMRVFADELTLSEGDLGALTDAQVAEREGEIIAFFTIKCHPDGVVELDHLFVDPGRFHRGIGSQLMAQAVQVAIGLDATELTLIADPNSEGFYAKHGAVVVGQHQSSIAGRQIPIMKLPLGGTGK